VLKFVPKQKFIPLRGGKSDLLSEKLCFKSFINAAIVTFLVLE
jgi:hypothetical protein